MLRKKRRIEQKQIALDLLLCVQWEWENKAIGGYSSDDRANEWDLGSPPTSFHSDQSQERKN